MLPQDLSHFSRGIARNLEQGMFDLHTYAHTYADTRTGMQRHRVRQAWVQANKCTQANTKTNMHTHKQKHKQKQARARTHTQEYMNTNKYRNKQTQKTSTHIKSSSILPFVYCLSREEHAHQELINTACCLLPFKRRAP